MAATEDQPDIVAAQSRAGRALVGWTPERLAEASGLDPDGIEAFEADLGTADPTTARAIRRALEEAGVMFLPELGASGVGVRLKFPRQTVKRIETWEGEGGTPAEDDIR